MIEAVIAAFIELLRPLSIRSLFDEVALRQTLVNGNYTQLLYQSIMHFRFCSPMFRICTVTNYCNSARAHEQNLRNIRMQAQMQNVKNLLKKSAASSDK